MFVASSNTNSMDHQLFEDPFASSISSLEADIFSGQLPSPPWADIELDDDVQDFSAQIANATYSGSGSGSGPRSHKKLSHNAYERDRRKQLNELYSSLRTLLPDSDQTKKLSIPSTVSRVLKYIPELQRQVENLERRKKELMNATSRQGVVGRLSECTSSPVVSATCINSKEVMVQISLLSNEASGTLPMSKCLRSFESEGLRLISSSTFSNFENRTFYNLHLQRSPGMVNMDNPSFCEKLVKVIKKKAGPAGIRR